MTTITTTTAPKTLVARCKSTYTNRDAQGNQLSPTRRCTAPEGHLVEEGNTPEKHRWMRPGNRVMWPESAADK